MAVPLRILQIEDSEDDALLVLRHLRKGGEYDVIARRVETPAELAEALAGESWDLVLSDYAMPHFNGLEALRLIQRASPDLPFILVSGAVGEEAAADIMRAGAGDVILKDKLSRLLPAVARELREAETRRRQRLAETALQESELRFRTLVDQAGDGFFLSDLTGRFVEVNEQACLSLGYSRQELLALTVYDIDADARRLRHRETIWEHMVAGDPITIETIHRRKDGTTFPVEVRLVLVEMEGKAYVQGLARDITERRRAAENNERLEAQLRQAQKMEAIGTLAGGIAHDFNNILTAIIGYAELLRYDLVPGSEASAKLEEIAKASNRARELVRHILTFSRNKASHREPLQVEPLVKEAVKLLRATIPTTIDIRQHLAPDCPMVLADPTQLHQVVVNLCTNAAQAMEHQGNGTIDLSLTCEEIRDNERAGRLGIESGRYLCLAVRDNGPGIAPEVMEHIFEPYFTTKEFGKGTGMGLAVVHGIVRGCGGGVEVQSEPGQGAVFRLYFPAVEAAVEPPAANKEEPAPGGSERLLFVDDEEMLVRLARSLFTGLGYRVTAMTSSLEALTLFRQNPAAFDCIVTDQTMPALSGLAFAREALAIRPDIPVVLCTGYSAVVDEDKAKDAGIRAFVQKPLVRNDIARVLRRALDGS
ncbi:MAG: response regulator [Thermodesulfobacteriota bacterium]